MKSCLPIIASLFIAATPFIPPVVALETEVIAQNIDPYIKDNIAREITVKISSKENGGSGVIIARQDNNYLVLTNNHVLRQEREFTIKTHDKATYVAQPVTNAIESNDDLAILQFSSDRSYQTATINSAATPREEQAILAVGYDTKTGELVTQAGTIELIPDRTFKDGYSIGYSSKIVQGMSGGAILNVNGEVIGINGKSAFPIIDTGYRYRDGSEPTAVEIEQYRKLSWGLSLNRFLTQLKPEIITAYNLPLPVNDEIGNSKPLTGWLGKLEAKAKQITVRIDSSSVTNGSGIIVAKEGNTYAVLTADHVICVKEDKPGECVNHNYEIVAPDGSKYPIDNSKTKRQEGVDLAVVRFTSDEDYQVAELANYPVKRGDAVFVAGYPKLNKNKPSQWNFSLGTSFEREPGLSNVSDNSLSPDDSGLIGNQGSLSGGYEMVYTSITYGGMSGGAVLDRDGRVIGIHGLAEGQTALDNRSGFATQVQLGYSLGIPVNTFIGLADRFGIDAALPVQDTRPRELNFAEVETLHSLNESIRKEIPQGNTTAKQWIERGNQLWRLANLDRAIQAFDRAIALNPKFIHIAYYGKGVVFSHEGMATQSDEKHKLALASFESAIEHKPNFEPAILLRIKTLETLGRFDEALVAIDKAILMKGDLARLYQEKGELLSYLNRYSEAEVAYQKVIQLNPNPSPVFYYSRGGLYGKQKKTNLALADFNQAIKLNPTYIDAFYFRGLIYEQQGEIELALADFDQVIKLNPREHTAYFLRGIQYFKKGKDKLALADFNQAIELNVNDNSSNIIDAIPHFHRGLIYRKQGKINLALADYNQAIKLDPNYAKAYFHRGVLYEEQGKKELALSDYNQAIKLNPNDALAYTMRGLNYAVQEKLNLALADFNQAIKLNPNDALAYINRGRTYYQLGQIEKAKLDWQKANELYIAQGNITEAEKIANLLQKLTTEPSYSVAESKEQDSPQSADEYFSRGRLYEKQGKLDLALSDFNEAVKLDPDYALAYVSRGLIFKKQGKLNLALSDFNEAVKIDSNFDLVYFNRGLIFEEQGKLDLALSDFNEAVKINPNYTLAYVSRGLIFEKQGKLDLAITDFSQAIYLEPNTTFVYFYRGNVYEKQGRINLAITDFSQVISLEPNNAIAYVSRGNVYFKQGIPELALTDYNKAIALNPNLAFAYNLRGHTYHQLEQIEKAKLDWHKAYDLYIAQGNITEAEKVANLLQKLPTEPSYSIAESSEQNSSLSAEEYFSRGSAYFKRGENDLAISDYTQAIELNPNLTEAYAMRGLLYQDQGKLDLALKDFNRAIELNPNLTEAYAMRGLLYQDQGQIEKAKLDWQKAYELYTAQGNIEGAEKVANVLQKLTTRPSYPITESAEQNSPRSAEEYFKRGYLYYQQGKLDLALKDFNQVISIHPNYAEAYGNRGLIYQKQGKFDLALANYNQVISIHPNDALAYLNRGTLYQEQGKIDLALTDYDRALKLSPNSAEAYVNRGLLYKDRGQIEKAKLDWHKAYDLFIAQGNIEAAEKVANLLKQLF